MRRILLLGVVAVLAVLMWFVVGLTPPKETAVKTVVIDEGSGVNAISQKLKQENIIRSTLVFETLVWAVNAERNLQAGIYEFGPHDSVLRVIDRLRTGSLMVRDSITFIEGWDLDEYRGTLGEYEFSVAEFDQLVSDAALWHERYSFTESIPQGRTMEGYLFPDTYAIDPERSVEKLVIKMLDNFESKFTESMRQKLSDARPLHDVVTLASIVEKEVSEISDRRRVAYIFLTRIAAAMPLQSDATIHYLTKSGRTRSTVSDLAIDSPYNTYMYQGLPPGPIGNPGLDAIEAVLTPEENPYVYFLTDGEGGVHYARTFEEHQENRRRFLE